MSLSLVSLLANFFILPAQPAIMVVGGIAGLAGAAWAPLAVPAAAAAWPFLAYPIRAVEWFSGWPGASLAVGRPGALFVVMYYALLFGVTAWLRRGGAQGPANAPGSGGFSHSASPTQPVVEPPGTGIGPGRPAGEEWGESQIPALLQARPVVNDRAELQSPGGLWAAVRQRFHWAHPHAETAAIETQFSPEMPGGVPWVC
jgi:hypothetical protein